MQIEDVLASNQDMEETVTLTSVIFDNQRLKLGINIDGTGVDAKRNAPSVTEIHTVLLVQLPRWYLSPDIKTPFN